MKKQCANELIRILKLQWRQRPRPWRGLFCVGASLKHKWTRMDADSSIGKTRKIQACVGKCQLSAFEWATGQGRRRANFLDYQGSKVCHKCGWPTASHNLPWLNSTVRGRGRKKGKEREQKQSDRGHNCGQCLEGQFIKRFPKSVSTHVIILHCMYVTSNGGGEFARKCAVGGEGNKWVATWLNSIVPHCKPSIARITGGGMEKNRSIIGVSKIRIKCAKMKS